MHDTQHLFLAHMPSQSQNGSSSMSESSGVGSRPKRGVGGGIGSTHFGGFDDDMILGWLSGALGFEDLKITTSALAFFEDRCRLARVPSRDGLALLVEDDLEEG